MYFTIECKLWRGVTVDNIKFEVKVCSSAVKSVSTTDVADAEGLCLTHQRQIDGNWKIR